MNEMVNQYLALNNPDNDYIFEQVENMLLSFFKNPAEVFFFISQSFSSLLKQKSDRLVAITEFNMILNEQIFNFYFRFAEKLRLKDPNLEVSVYIFKITNLFIQVHDLNKKAIDINIHMVSNILHQLEQGYSLLCFPFVMARERYSVDVHRFQSWLAVQAWL